MSTEKHNPLQDKEVVGLIRKQKTSLSLGLFLIYPVLMFQAASCLPERSEKWQRDLR
jgi:hypothetical protein